MPTVSALFTGNLTVLVLASLVYSSAILLFPNAVWQYVTKKLACLPTIDCPDGHLRKLEESNLTTGSQPVLKKNALSCT